MTKQARLLRTWTNDAYGPTMRVSQMDWGSYRKNRNNREAGID